MYFTARGGKIFGLFQSFLNCPTHFVILDNLTSAFRSISRHFNCVNFSDGEKTKALAGGFVQRGVAAAEAVRVNFFFSSYKLVFDGVITCLELGAHECRVVMLPRLLGNFSLSVSYVVIKLILLFLFPLSGEILLGYV